MSQSQSLQTQRVPAGTDSLQSTFCVQVYVFMIRSTVVSMTHASAFANLFKNSQQCCGCAAGMAVLDSRSFEAALKQEILLSAGEQRQRDCCVVF